MKFVISLVFIFSCGIFSQDIPSTSNGELKFYVDHSSFKGKEGKTYQEFYLMIHADQLEFDDQSKQASFEVNAVLRMEEKLVSEKKWITNALLSRDSTNLKSLVVYDQWAEILNPGYYKVLVNVVEQEYRTSGQAVFEINVPSFDNENLSASSIEFISKVDEANGDNHFEKNGKVVIPNPWRRYGLLIPKLSFYYEIYNIQNPADGFLSIDYSILNKENAEVKNFSDVEVKKSGKDLSIVHAIDLTDLNSGIYTLTAEITDPQTNHKCSQSRSFEIIQIDYLTNNPLLTEDEAETGGKLIEYFATPKELEIFESLSLQGKTNFLISFWKEKDTTPGTPENEFLQTTMQRFNYANQYYGWGKIEGYKTDKGRILIKYGIPEETESYSSESNTSPFEIWTYTRDKQFIFVFGDINSNGNYVLLHSTKEGEVSDYSWKDYLRAF